ncbi:MAG: glycosyltransferase family 4 protein [Ignavibacteria bacterium]|nr:glycosyltransferase family 4 protein [Ignavibacteria bacterium]
MNVLLLANELRYTCGVTNHLLHLSRSLTQEGKVKLWIICGGGNGINRFSGIDVNIVSDERFLHANRSFTTMIKAINFLTRFTRENSIEIIHSHYHYGAAIAAKAAKLTGRPTIQTNHGILPQMGRLKHFNADYYVAISEHIKRHILSKKIADESRIHFIRCGIPITEPMPDKPNNGKLKILAASRFIQSKGLDIYIHAVNKLPGDVFNIAEFHLAGEGELKESLTALNSSLGSKVIINERINDIYETLKHTNILVNSSIRGYEGFPAIITEAGATNTLVITSDFEGAEDVIKHGLNGLIYSYNSSEKLCGLLEDSIYNYNQYISLSKKLYDFTKQEFSIEQMRVKHIELYGKCRRK